MECNTITFVQAFAEYLYFLTHEDRGGNILSLAGFLLIIGTKFWMVEVFYFAIPCYFYSF